MMKKTASQPATIDGASLRVLTSHPAIKLHDADAIRREMARVYRDARTGVIPTDEASRLVYMLSCIAKTLTPEPPAVAPPAKVKTLADFYRD